MKQGYRFILLAIYLILIFYVLTKPISKSFVMIIEYWPFKIPIDKCIHFCLFTPMPFFLWICTFKQKKEWIRYVTTASASILIAFSTEILQFFLPRRSFEWLDIVADVSGITFGFILTVIIYHIWKKTIENYLSNNQI
ncbi:MAG: VanZ family protein [Bacteroidales bacterium]|nr:VanZ family protein [Bacteroidales bacterium]